MTGQDLRVRPRGAVELSALVGLAHAPTPEQVAVVEAPLEPMLVVAGAGSGKTETMAARVVWLVDNGFARPEEVLGLTFTRKAAAELAERIDRRLRRLPRRGPATAFMGDRPRISTYNAYAAGLVREHGLRLGVEPGARLLTEAGRWQLAERLVEAWPGELPFEFAPSTLVGAVVDLAGALAEHLLAPAEAAQELCRLAESLADREPAPTGRQRDVPRADVRRTIRSLRDRAALVAVVEAFQKRKDALGVVDFGDQVALACRISRELPEVGAGERERYKVVLLDEYQDTSVAQVALLSAIFGAGHPVTAVGDPHQAIYGWRGASAAAVDRFPQTFRRADGSPPVVAALSTSWRNDTAVLAAAHVLAAPLRSAAGSGAPGGPRRAVDLPALSSRAGAGTGRVQVLYAETSVEEAFRVAEAIDRHRRDRTDRGALPTTAVLCRARSQMPALVDALRGRGLPVEVLGLGGLLTTPEVADLHAALMVAHDPGRADGAVRLLTRLRLGVADLAALRDRARELAALGRGGEGVREAETATLVEAVEHPPPPGWQSRSGRTLSPAGAARIADLGDALRMIRAHAHLPMPELVSAAERRLGLDIEVLARPGLDPREARRHLDEFAETAAQFGDGSAEPSLGAFLSWLEAAAEHERGLDTVEVDADPHAVQVLTVHAAKGLEWDVVAVVGLSEGTFPAYDGRPCDHPTSSAWLTALDTLPYPLRQDAADLPALDLGAPVDHAEMAAECEAFRVRAGAHLLSEERRLAYVAVTRARRELLLSGSWWKEQARQPRPPSRFLSQLRRAGVVAELPGGARWDAPASDVNPLQEGARSVLWPSRPADEESAAWRRAVAAVEQARRERGDAAGALGSDAAAWAGHPSAAPRTAALSERARGWLRDARLLLAEQEGTGAPDLEVALPAHLSASAVVRMVADPAAFALERRRPVPTEPTVAARRGTRFHAWVERHFGSATLLDVDDLAGVDDEALGSDPELAALRESFLASRWASRTPLAVEVALETPVAGAMVRCRVDAVFADEDGVEIIDWKTGSPPSTASDAEARQVQLALYRLAWSRLHALPLGSVRAAFYHVAQDLLVPAEPLSEAEIVEAVRARLSAVHGFAGALTGKDVVLIPPPAARL